VTGSLRGGGGDQAKANRSKAAADVAMTRLLRRMLCSKPPAMQKSILRRKAVGAFSGSLMALTGGAGFGNVIKWMQSSAGLTKGDTTVTALAVLIPSAVLLLVDAAPRDLVNFPGAVAMAIGGLAAAPPATGLKAVVPTGAATVAIGAMVGASGLAALGSNASQLRQDAEAAFSRAADGLIALLGHIGPRPHWAPRELSTPSAQELLTTSWASLTELPASLSAHCTRAIVSLPMAVKSAVESAPGMPGLIYEQGQRQADAMTTEDAAWFAVAGGLRRMASGAMGPTIGLFVLPVPLLVACTGLDARAAFATFCMSVLPKASERIALRTLQGHRPRFLAVAPFAIGFLGASTVAGYAVLHTPHEYTGGALGVLYCCFGGMLLRKGMKALLL